MVFESQQRAAHGGINEKDGSKMEVGTELIPVEKQDHIKKALEFFQSLREIKIASQQEYDNAVDLCKKVKVELNTLESDRKELVKPYKDKSTLIDKEYKSVRDNLENAERVIKNGMGIFFRAQEVKRIEEQRKVQADIDAKKRAEETRLEAERKKAEQYREQGREDMAEKAEARAATVEKRIDTMVAPIVENQAKVAGVSYKTIYKVSVVNHSQAITALVANPFFHAYLTIDLKGIEKVANVMKGKMPPVDGLLVSEDVQSSVRT